MELKPLLGRLAYGGFFVVALPVLLWRWTVSLDLSLPALHVPAVGWVLLAAGLLTIALAMHALWHRGGGLPMNAFPPPRFVASGVYRLLPHPIYLGAVVVCAGVSILSGSAVGLWLTTPIVALGCLAIVVGFEAPDLDRRFGAERPRPLVSLPPGGAEPPAESHRWGAMLFVLVPWVIAYEGVKLLGVPPDAIDVRLPGEAHWPVWPWTEIIYVTSYLVVPLAFFLAPTRDALRAFAVRGVVATVAVTLVYLCVPVIAPFRPPAGDDWLSRLVLLEQTFAEPPVAAFPSFHVIWAGLVAQMLATRGRVWKWSGWTWAIALSASCIATGMHALADVVAGMLCWIPLCHAQRLFRALLDACERLGDSWKSWRVGPLRIINHSIYASAAAFVGMLGIGWLTADPFGTSIVALAGLVGAGLWAQLVEGSSLLQRPFGYFGYLIGGSLCVVVMAALGYPAWPLAAAFGAVGAVVQSVGRLRCLVQGCCHGRPTRIGIGMRVTNPHSRICKIAHLVGTPIHATPLYSILANLAIGALLLRLWAVGASLALICGGYLVLGGLARFMEEAWRGEPQTRVLAGLPIYQWLAIASVAVGMVLFVVEAPAAVLPPGLPSPGLLVLAVVHGVIFWFAMGVDFPESNRRFARLSG